MTDKENLEAAFIFGQEAEKVLSNSAYQFAITSMKGQILDKLANVSILSDNGDNKAVVELARELQAINKIESQLEKIMREGAFAEANLNAKSKTQHRQR